MSNQIASLFATIGADASQAISEVNKFIDSFKSAETRASEFQDKLNKSGLAGQTYNDFIKEQAKSTNSVADSLVNLGKKVLTVAAVYKAAKWVRDATYDYVAYADEVRNVSRMIGATTEESSRLIQVSDQVGVTTNTLTSSMQMAIRKGYEPTIAGLMQMSKEYNALTDPMEKVLYLQERFTRGGSAGGGAGMAPLLELGPERIAQMGADVKSGLVLSQQEVYQARLTSFMLNDLVDTYNTVKFKVGEGVGQGLYSFFATDETKTKDLLNYANELNNAGVSAEVFAEQMNIAAGKAGYLIDEAGNLRQFSGQLFGRGGALGIEDINQPMIAEGFMAVARAQKEVGIAAKFMTDAEKEAYIEEQEANQKIRNTVGGMLIKNAITSDGISASMAYNDTMAQLAEREAELNDLLENGNLKRKERQKIEEELGGIQTTRGQATTAFEQQTGITAYNLTTAGMGDATQQELLAVAHATGILNDKNYGLQSAYADVMDGLDGTIDGLNQADMSLQSNQQKVEAATGALIELSANTPEGWTVDSYYNIFKTTYIRTVYGSGGGQSKGKGSTGDTAIDYDIANRGMHGGEFVGLQHGGIVPPGFSNDGMPVFVSSGERMSVEPAGNKNIENTALIAKLDELNYKFDGLPRAIRDAIQTIV